MYHIVNLVSFTRAGRPGGGGGGSFGAVAMLEKMAPPFKRIWPVIKRGWLEVEQEEEEGTKSSAFARVNSIYPTLDAPPAGIQSLRAPLPFHAAVGRACIGSGPPFGSPIDARLLFALPSCTNNKFP